MSTAERPIATILRWHDGVFAELDYCDPAETAVLAADSWFVTDGRSLALDLHRSRFLRALPDDIPGERFWTDAIMRIPSEGDWFPRVELQSRRGAHELVLRLRSAPERRTSAVLATAASDPRTNPTVKGPDLEAMLRLRTLAQASGADEAVILSPDGYVVEGAYSALVWWRGAILCTPPAEFERIDSVTARALLGLAAALGVELFEEAVTPAELDGTELWALSALHGPRIATRWVDGPSLAALPGRLRLWRERLEALRHPLG